MMQNDNFDIEDPYSKTCRRAQVVSLRSSRCRESSKCKEGIPFYCSSLANLAASCEVKTRWSIFKISCSTFCGSKYGLLGFIRARFGVSNEFLVLLIGLLHVTRHAEEGLQEGRGKVLEF